MKTTIEFTPVSESTDWQALTEIINHYISESMACYPDVQVNNNFFTSKWQNALNHPFYQVTKGKHVIGFGYLAPFYAANTMQRTATLTYFIHPQHTGKGIGRNLLQLLVEQGQKAGITNFLAHISSHNEGSIRFHANNGFTECGRFKAVGNKFDREFDMVWMQRIEG